MLEQQVTARSTIDSMSVHLVNVVADRNAGLLDEIPQDETDQDLAAILGYIRAEQRALARNPGRGRPSIARSVLTTIWQKPRTEFHREEVAGRIGSSFGSKLLLIPWSIEAFAKFNSQNDSTNLVLEHVTPIDALWNQLVELEKESEDDKTWAREAQAYLRTNYALAVVTRAQASAIDKVGLRKTGFKGRPFLRYQEAACLICKGATEGGPHVSLDVAKFVYPGLAVKEHTVELVKEDEDEVRD